MQVVEIKKKISKKKYVIVFLLSITLFLSVFLLTIKSSSQEQTIINSTFTPFLLNDKSNVEIQNINQITLSPHEVYNGFHIVSITGNESVLFSIDDAVIDRNQITFYPRMNNGDGTYNNSRTREECSVVYEVDVGGNPVEDENGDLVILLETCQDVTYSLDNFMPIRNSPNVTDILRNITRNPDNTFTWNFTEQELNILKSGGRLYLGTETITIEGDTSYSAVNNGNVTQENGFAHLNISGSSPYDGLIVYIPFDNEGATDAPIDWSDNNQDTTRAGNPQIGTSNCLYGDCATFDGANDEYRIADSSVLDSITGEMSFSVWVRPNFDQDETSNRMVFIKGTGATVPYEVKFRQNIDDWHFKVTVGGSNTNCATTDLTWSANTWHHFAGIYNGSDIDLYWDGAFERDCSKTGNVDDNNDYISIGEDSNGGEDFDGKIDELMIWNVALSEQDIFDIYNNQSARFKSHGELLFENLNVGNNTANVTISQTETLLYSNLSAYFNHEVGNRVYFVNGLASDITISGNNADANLSIEFWAGNGTTLSETQTFYSPLVIGNITIDSWNIGGGGDTTPPEVTINFPTATTYSGSDIPLNFNVTLNENGSVMYSLDSGENNISMFGDENPFGTAFNHTNTSIADGTYTFSVYANDTSGNNNYTHSIQFSVDQTAPNVSLLTESPTDSPTYMFTERYEFNATINDTNLDAVFLQFDGVNYSATNSGELYNFSLYNLPAGTYNYLWYTNDTLGNVNNSETGTYTINKATPTGSLTGTGEFEYPYESTVTGSESNSGDGDITYGLFRDDIAVSNPETDTLSAGEYNYTYNSSEGQNYSATVSLDSKILNITQNDTLVLSIDLSPSNTENFGTETTSTGNDCPTELTCSLFLDNSSVANPHTATLGAGDYVYYFNTSGNTNYSNTEITADLTINRISVKPTLKLNDTLTNLTMPYPSQVNASANTSITEQTIELFRDGVGVTAQNHLFQNLASGYYNFTIRVNQTQNYTKQYTTLFANITKAESNISALIDSVRANKTILNGTIANLSGILQTGDSSSFIELYNNGTLIHNATSPISNNTNFTTLGIHNITAFYYESENYTSSFETWFLNITFTENTPPTITLNFPGNNTLVEPVIFNATVFDVDDDMMNATFYINGNNVSTIINLTNNSKINYQWNDATEGTHTWFVNATDGLTNATSEVRTFRYEVHSSTNAGGGGSSSSSITSTSDGIIQLHNLTLITEDEWFVGIHNLILIEVRNITNDLIDIDRITIDAKINDSLVLRDDIYRIKTGKYIRTFKPINESITGFRINVTANDGGKIISEFVDVIVIEPTILQKIKETTKNKYLDFINKLLTTVKEDYKMIVVIISLICFILILSFVINKSLHKK